MQPDSGDTTNALLVQLIQVTVHGSSAIPDISNLSSTTRYPSSTAWAQTLAYIALALSILAAFGAVVGKQCLYSFEAARKRGGSLEESGTRRQTNLDGLQYLRLRTCLLAFLMFLQVALLFFSVSLCLKTWTDPLSTFVVTVCTAAFVVLFYAGSIFLLAWWQDNPVPISRTELVRAISEKFCRAITSTSSPTPNKSSPIPDKSTPIRWILETSTNQGAVEAAVAMVHLTQWLPNLDVSAAFERLRDNFEANYDKEELYVKFGKAMAHFCIQPVKIDKALVDKLFRHDNFPLIRSRFIRDAFTACYDAYCHLNKTPPLEEDMRRKHRASARTALRTMVVHGLDFHLSLPDNETLIWNGNLCWSDSDGRKPDCEEFDWLVDYLADEVGYDKADETGDALLALSAIRGLGSPAKQSSYINSLICCMNHRKPSRVRYAALRTVYEVRDELVSITSSSKLPDIDAKLLDKLSAALREVMDPKYDDRINASRDLKYIDIILTMTKNDEWCRRLADNYHLQQCISLVTVDGVQMYDRNAGFHLTVIIGRLYTPSKNKVAFYPCRTQIDPWWKLIKNTWMHTRHYVGNDEYIDGIPALVTATRSRIFSGERPADVTRKVQEALHDLQNPDRQATFVQSGVAQAAIDAAIHSVQGLYNYLHGMVE
ncbi:uncharacterized protein BJ212DRAFT_1426470 [Suillus subaureus]|uniref:DUF6535 domain-containing protein n=1 Tax=Suillus subaureus TaxID=48587 RepID=A0A9P7JHB8_9AGAM|nr:uncharacterized protein BJ212DRAFT_1426470 [Suillus subaureus]KAG1822041.1 hypothetical protein BJ212DRAFT_1426470 [Suillus subaureus]